MKRVMSVVLLLLSMGISTFAAVTISPDDTKINFTGVVEKNMSASGMELFRLKKSYIDMSNGGYWSQKNAGTQAGISIQIQTSSPTVSFNFALNNTYEDRYARIVLYRNGVEVKTEQGGVGTTLSISGAAAEESALWTCVLPSFKAQFLQNIELADGHALESIAAVTKPAYVAIGNSITHGVGHSASLTTATYAWQVAEAFNYELYNMAVGGSKINTQILDNLAGLSPDLITVLWGYNDVNSPWDLDKAMSKYDSLMSSLVKTYPQTKIVAIKQTYTTTTTGSQVPENSIDRLRTEQLAILQDLQTTHKNLFVVNGLDYTDATSLNDVVHLNDQGAKDLSTGLITEIPTFIMDDIDPVTSDTIIFRSEYEKVGDVLGNIPAFKQVVIGKSDLNYVTVESDGSIKVTTAISDLKYEVHTINITAEQVSGDTLKVKIVDGVDYWLEQHGGTITAEHLNLKVKDEWAVHNNLWGKGTALVGTDFRIEMAYKDGLPDSTLLVWDVPSEAKDFGGSSVWNYSNLLWGNRYGERDDLEGFPFQLSDYDSLILDFDYLTLHDEEGHKVALNLFTTETDTLAPFSENRGDFFMVFDQKGTWVPPYPDTLHSDTTLMGTPYIILHQEGVKNSEPYHWRRAIIKDSKTVEQGSIDLMQLFNRFGDEGYMDQSLSIPNIQFGVEVTKGIGAVRFNKLAITGKSGSPITKTQNTLKKDALRQSLDQRGILKLNSLAAMKKVVITNSQGRILKEFSLSSVTTTELNLSDLSSGVYVGQVFGVDGAVKSFQFVK